MRQIDLTEYRVKVAPYGQVGDGSKDQPTNGSQEELVYDVRHSLIEVLFTLQLTPEDLLDADEIATKIRDCPDNTLLLKEEEYGRLIQTIKPLKLFGPRDVEFVRRILKAPQVEVKEKAPTT